MTPSQPRHLYGAGYTNAAAGHTRHYIWDPVFRLLSTLPAGTRILDAGCGNGAFTTEMHRRGFNVVGMDLEPSGIEQARKQCPGVRFEVASVYDDIGTLFGERFDAVVTLEVLEHLYDPKLFTRRVFDCLKPGGMFILTTPYHGYLKNVALALSGNLDAHFTALWDGGHIKFWSRRTLTTMLEEAGLAVEYFAGTGRIPYLWKSMILVATRR
jgi:2-polyprenyl-3-methyl-5-hydroxy-6-metoxy-1,4-benzoquinol methylase